MRDYLERLNLIYYGLIALPLVLFPVVYLPIKDSISTGIDKGSLLLYLAALLLFLVIYFARRLFRRNLSVIQIEWQLSKKLMAYRKASVIFYLFGLISCLVSVGLLMFTNHQLFVATYPVLLLILSFYRPTLERLKRDLPLTEKDLSVINDHQ